MRIVALGLLVASAASAQTAQNVAAYQSLLLTPVGALPPTATSSMTGVVQNGVQFALRYGYVSNDNSGVSFNNVGATAILPMGLGTTVSLTGGITAPTSCGGCTAGVLLGVGGDARLTEMALGTGRDGSRIIFSLNGDVGFSNPKLVTRNTMASGAVGLPIALVSGGPANTMHFAPFVTPAFGFGRREVSVVTGSNATDSGTRFMLGAGILLYNQASNVSFDLGAQHIAIAGGQTQIGLGLMLGGH